MSAYNETAKNLEVAFKSSLLQFTQDKSSEEDTVETRTSEAPSGPSLDDWEVPQLIWATSLASQSPIGWATDCVVESTAQIVS